MFFLHWKAISVNNNFIALTLYTMITLFEAFKFRKLSLVNCVTSDICVSRVVELEASMRMSSCHPEGIG